MKYISYLCIVFKRRTYDSNVEVGRLVMWGLTD